MRILRAYKEISTITPTNRNWYELELAVEMDVAVTAMASICYFTYNRQVHVIYVYRDGVDTWQTFNPSTTFTHLVPIKAIKVDSTYYVPEIGALVAKLTSTTLVSNVVSGGTNTFKLRSHNHTETYLDFTSLSPTGTYLTSITRSVNVIAEQVEGLSLAAHIDLDIDDKTAIGLNFQAFDFGRPVGVKSNVSNTFTLPRTTQNDKLINGSEFLQDNADSLYSVWYVDYWADSHKHIDKARLMVDSIDVEPKGGRISCVIYEGSTGLDRLKDIPWAEFMSNYAIWLVGERTTSWATSTVDYAGLDVLLADLAVSTDHVFIPYIFGDFHKNALNPLESSEGSVGREGEMVLTLNMRNFNGGHICVYVNSLFEFLAERYNIDLMGAPDNSIFDRTIEGNLFIQTRHLIPVIFGDRIEENYTYYLVYSNGAKPVIENPILDKEQKTVWDFVEMFVKQTNCLIDTVSENTYALRSFEDIELAPVIDFSGKYTQGFTFSPLIDGIAATNTVDFNKYSELLTTGIFKRVIKCDNKNLKGNTIFASIPSFVPPFFQHEAVITAAFYEKGSYEEFTLMTLTAATFDVAFYYEGYSAYEEYVATLKVPVIYGLELTYNKYESLISKPKRFKIKRWMSFEDVKDLKFFALYHIPELNGTFFINKISGFNPDGAKAPTEIELVFVNHKLPT